MSCLEAGVPHGPGRSLLPPENDQGGGAGWGQSTVLGQWGHVPSGQDPPAPAAPTAAAQGGQLLRPKPQGWPRAGELATRPGGQVACPPGLVASRLPSWATPHLWGGRVLQIGLRDRRAQPMESPTCRERRLGSNSHSQTRTGSRGARSMRGQDRWKPRWPRWGVLCAPGQPGRPPTLSASALLCHPGGPRCSRPRAGVAWPHESRLPDSEAPRWGWAVGVRPPECLKGAPRAGCAQPLRPPGPHPALGLREQGREHTGISASRELSQTVCKFHQVTVDIVLRT